MAIEALPATAPPGEMVTLVIWGLSIAALLASLGVGLAIRARLRDALPVVPGTPWPPAEWHAAETGLIAFGWLLIVAVIVSTLPAEAPLIDRMAMQGVGSILGTLAMVALLRLHGISWRSIGLSSDDPAGDLRIAAAGLGLVVGPLLLIAAVLERLVPYEHPVIDTLAAAPGLPTLVAVVVAAVIAAPLAEEFFFRRILLGWLDTRFPSPGGRFAIVTSAILFGLAHWGQGLGWIPLIGLGIVLGEITRRRGTLVPAILLHAMFNGVSVVLLVVQIAAGTVRPAG